MATSWRSDARTHQWRYGLNWTNGVPVAGEDTNISGDFTFFIALAPPGPSQPDLLGTLTIEQATVTFSTGTLNFAPTVNNDSLTYDVILRESATLRVAASATLIGRQTLMMGADGSDPHMYVSGSVSEDYALIKGGQLVVGAGGHWTAGTSGLVVGGVNGARLTVANGGIVDGGSDDLAIASQSLSIGGYGPGSVVVSGAGSLLSETGVWVGVEASGSLYILNGGVVQDQYAVVAYNGDANIVVSGENSRWDNLRGLQFGISYPTNSRLTLVNHGELDWGSSGFHLDDNLFLDSTAVLGGQTIYDGGVITALTANGSVEIEQDIRISRNWLFGGSVIASVSAAGPNALILSGQITGVPDSMLRIGSGRVELDNPDNHFGGVEIWSGTLVAWTPGDLGDGVVSFIGGAQTHATLSIDGSHKFDNSILHFGATDTIDVNNFYAGGGVSKKWVEDSSNLFGVLTLKNASKSLDLHFYGDHAASDFRVGNDLHGGTLVRLAPTA